MEYIRNIQGISIDIYDQKHRPNGAAAEGGACVSDHKYFWICLVYSLYIPHIFHIYFLVMFHIFSLVCFLIYGVKRRSGHVQIPIYGVKRRSGHDGSQSFGPISHVSGQEIVF